MRDRLCARLECRAELPPPGRGRPRKFCSRRCRDAEQNTVFIYARILLVRRYPEEFKELVETIRADRAKLLETLPETPETT